MVDVKFYYSGDMREGTKTGISNPLMIYKPAEGDFMGAILTLVNGHAFLLRR